MTNVLGEPSATFLPDDETARVALDELRRAALDEPRRAGWKGHGPVPW